MIQEKSAYHARPKARPIVRPRLHHITLMTLDVDAMVAWYELVAGLEPVYYSEGAAWMTNDDANHRLALLKFPGLKAPVDKPNTAGLHHMAFEYSNFDQWLDNFIRLRNEGILPVMCLDHGMTMSLYYVDPEGNGVEIQVDNFGDWGMSKEWMWASQEFATDQLGPQFDPEKLVLARAAGLDGDAIHKRAYAGEYVPANAPDRPVLPDVWADKLVGTTDSVAG